MAAIHSSDIYSFLQQTHDWVENQISQLNPEARIAQLIHVAAYSNRDQSHTDYILELVEKHKIGGLTFFQGHPIKQAELTNLYQSKASIPLMISIDGEWGLGMRLDETMSFPYQMALGAIEDDALIYEMGKEIAIQCRRIGIHVNFAPDIDVNNNPANPVIGFRSFGENLDRIVSKATAYMRGMQDQGVLACAKHFPGHGDTDVDSHFDLPVISHDRSRLEAIELHPFYKLFEQGVGSAMVSHLHIPALDPVDGRAATLSPPIVNDLLKKEMGYGGLIFTDALDMKGVSKTDTPAEVGMKALLAGHDVLLNLQDVPATILEIQKAIKLGLISQEEIDARCRKNLAMKLWLGLDSLQPVSLDHIIRDIHPASAKKIRTDIYAQSVTQLGTPLLLNQDDQRIAVIAFHAQSNLEELPAELKQHALEKGKVTHQNLSLTPLQQSLSQQQEVVHFHITAGISEKTFQETLEQLQHFDKIVLGLHGIAIKARNRFGISDSMIHRVNTLLTLESLTVCVFASAYVINLFEWPSTKRILLAYQENEYSQRAVADVLLGTKEAKGKLPVAIDIMS